MSSHGRGESLTIFHVDGEHGLRGGERQLLYLAAALRAMGHVNVICCRRGSELEQEALRQDLETLVLPFFFEFDPVSAWILARAALQCARPVVHAHTGHAAGIAAVCRRLGGPAIVAHRRVDFPIRSRLSRWVKYDGIARVVAVSTAVAGVLARDGLPKGHIIVIPDAIPVSREEWRWTGQDIPALAPADPERRRGARRVLSETFGLDPALAWVGTLSALVPHKDHETLIAAANQVLIQRPGTRFLIAGRGPEAGRLLAAIERWGLHGRVVLLGHREPAEVLASLDLFVLSSSGEGMGSVLLEAMACGVPVAATAAGGIPEVVEDGRTGLLAPPRDPGALARCIISLLEDPDRARRLSAAALQTLPKFSLAQAARRMEELYGMIG